MNFTFYLIFLLLLVFIFGMDCNWKKGDFTVIHQNIRGLFSKKDYVAEYLTQNNIKLCALSETLLNESIPNAFIEISGYLSKEETVDYRVEELEFI